MLHPALALAAFACAAPLALQDAPPPAPSLPWPIAKTRAAFGELGERGYLRAFMALTEPEGGAPEESMLRSTWLDVLGTHAAYVGEERRALEAGDQAFPREQADFASDVARADFLDGVEPEPAVAALVAAAEECRFVLLNEEHRSSRQRAFAHRVLEPLRAAGFTHLALETLNEEPAALAGRGYPTMTSGTYTRDPLLGDLVRRALALGFVVIGYEAPVAERLPRPDDASPLDAINRREAGQARRLFDQTLGQDPDARVLVFAGRDHIAEAEAGGWTPMGMLLARMAETDPLSVSLLAMTEHADRVYERKEYRAVDAAGWLDAGPVVLRNADGALWSEAPEALDVHVFFPRAGEAHGRPDWAGLDGLRVPVAVGDLVERARTAAARDADGSKDAVGEGREGANAGDQGDTRETSERDQRDTWETGAGGQRDTWETGAGGQQDPQGSNEGGGARPGGDLPSAAVASESQPLLVQALLTGETAQPVPVDQAIAWPGEPVPHLLLRPGRYTLRAVDRTGRVLAEHAVEVTR